MKHKKGPGIRCMECGCNLDPGERCDCERLNAERKALEQQAKRRRIVEHNMRVVEQAQIEWEYA